MLGVKERKKQPQPAAAPPLPALTDDSELSRLYRELDWLQKAHLDLVRLDEAVQAKQPLDEATVLAIIEGLMGLRCYAQLVRSGKVNERDLRVWQRAPYDANLRGLDHLIEFACKE